MSFANVPAGKDLPHDFNVIIEIPAQSDPVKYEADKDLGVLVVDRFVGTGMRYPVNYGFIPQTLSGDGDPVDVLVITPFPLLAGSVVRSRALGMLQMTDESGVDAKLIAVPHDKVCPMTANIKTLDDVPEYLKDQIKHFFENYKALEKGKWVKVEGWVGIEAAHKEITEGLANAKAVRFFHGRGGFGERAGFASSRRFGFRFVARGHFDRHRRQHRFQCACACRERALFTRREPLDPVFGARGARAIGEFELREHLHGLARARVARARAVGVLRKTRGHVDGDARVDAAVGAFEQVEKPRRSVRHVAMNKLGKERECPIDRHLR
jgi:inorganic pyrophosphatase